MEMIPSAIYSIPYGRTMILYSNSFAVKEAGRPINTSGANCAPPGYAGDPACEWDSFICP